MKIKRYCVCVYIYIMWKNYFKNVKETKKREKNWRTLCLLANKQQSGFQDIRHTEKV